MTPGQPTPTEAALVVLVAIAVTVIALAGVLVMLGFRPTVGIGS